VTINVTTVSKHFYEIKILPIIRTCAWKVYTNASLIYGGKNDKQNCRFGKNGRYIHRKIVHHDEFCYWLKLMYLFLLHPIGIKNISLWMIVLGGIRSKAYIINII
jgi:hypothetical protein